MERHVKGLFGAVSHFASAAAPLAFAAGGIKRPARLQPGYGGDGSRLHQFTGCFHTAALQKIDQDVASRREQT